MNSSGKIQSSNLDNKRLHKKYKKRKTHNFNSLKNIIRNMNSLIRNKDCTKRIHHYWCSSNNSKSILCKTHLQSSDISDKQGKLLFHLLTVHKSDTLQYCIKGKFEHINFQYNPNNYQSDIASNRYFQLFWTVGIGSKYLSKASKY